MGFEDVTKQIRSDTNFIKSRFLNEAAGDNVVIFGAGNCGHRIYHILQGYGVTVRCFCDNRTAGNTDETTGLSVISPKELYDTVENPTILVCVADKNVCKMICGQLTSLGFDGAQLHEMNAYFWWLTREYFDSNIQKYRKAYQLMDDEFSKQVYLGKLQKVFLLNDISAIVSPWEEEYFDSKVLLTDHEVFIDCGGFDGDSAKKFIQKCGGHYKEIIIFEPERCKKEAIQKNLGDNLYELYPYGVWSKTKKLYFNGLGTVASHISENGHGDMIEAVSLDEAVYDKRPTFIKMDIEGAEQEALKGCRKIIQSYKPKLAICVYHKPEDFYEIPSMLKEMNPEYKLYMRQYADAWYDTVLYAV